MSYATASPDGEVAKVLRQSLTSSGIKIPAWRDREKALRYGDVFTASAANIIILIRDLGLQCVETGRAARVLQGFNYGDHGSGRQAAEWILRRWKGSVG